MCRGEYMSPSFEGAPRRIGQKCCTSFAKPLSLNSGTVAVSRSAGHGQTGHSLRERCPMSHLSGTSALDRTKVGQCPEMSQMSGGQFAADTRNSRREVLATQKPTRQKNAHCGARRLIPAMVRRARREGSARNAALPLQSLFLSTAGLSRYPGRAGHGQTGHSLRERCPMSHLSGTSALRPAGQKWDNVPNVPNVWGQSAADTRNSRREVLATQKPTRQKNAHCGARRLIPAMVREGAPRRIGQKCCTSFAKPLSLNSGTVAVSRSGRTRTNGTLSKREMSHAHLSGTSALRPAGQKWDNVPNVPNVGGQSAADARQQPPGSISHAKTNPTEKCSLRSKTSYPRDAASGGRSALTSASSRLSPGDEADP